MEWQNGDSSSRPVSAVASAPSGSVICLGAGSYPATKIYGARPASDVAVRPATGAAVSIGQINIDTSSHLRFTGTGGSMKIAAIDADPIEGNAASKWITIDHAAYAPERRACTG